MRIVVASQYCFLIAINPIYLNNTNDSTELIACYKTIDNITSHTCMYHYTNQIRQNITKAITEYFVEAELWLLFAYEQKGHLYLQHALGTHGDTLVKNNVIVVMPEKYVVVSMAAVSLDVELGMKVPAATWVSWLKSISPWNNPFLHFWLRCLK